MVLLDDLDSDCNDDALSVSVCFIAVEVSNNSSGCVLVVVVIDDFAPTPAVDVSLTGVKFPVITGDNVVAAAVMELFLLAPDGVQAIFST